MKYSSKITGLGSKITELTDGNMLILFYENAPEELKEYCVLHKCINNFLNFSVGDLFCIGEQGYKITAFGKMAQEHLETLGHVTLIFDAKDCAGMDGYIHLDGTLKMPKPGEEIVIY